MQSQSTFAALARDEEGRWCARVLKQKIWVEGVSYELQEIYGMENSAPTPAQPAKEVRARKMRRAVAPAPVPAVCAHGRPQGVKNLAW